MAQGRIGRRIGRRIRRGFSLVELLVVIGIIALLISILMPVLRNSREVARQIVCANQLHQIGLAFHMYANANNGSMPSWSGWHVYPDGSSPYDSPGLGWVEQMAPYVKPTDPVYNCPSFPAKFYNYFMESCWSGVNGRHATKFTDITMTSRFIIAGECTQPTLYPPPFGSHGDPSDDCDRDDYGGKALLFPNEGGFIMHKNGTNVLFDDTHVECFKAYDPTRITFHPRKMASWDQVMAEGPDDARNPAPPNGPPSPSP